MILDGILIVILIISIIYGFRKGFVFTLIHTVGWALTLVLSFIATPPAMKLLENKTGLYDWFYEGITSRFDTSLDNLEVSM